MTNGLLSLHCTQRDHQETDSQSIAVKSMESTIESREYASKFVVSTLGPAITPQRIKSIMTRNKKTVADRQKSLHSVSPEPQFSLFGAQEMYAGMGAEETHCTISRYCRTRIFEFPGIDFRPAGDEPHHELYVSPSVQACVTSNLVDYFVNSTWSKHYAISPSLRHMVAETDEKIKTQQKDRVPVFLVIEEFDQLPPVEMNKGECSILDAVVLRDGEEVPRLVGGRAGEKFIVACATVDGAWPELPNNQQLVNMILAGVRIGQQTEQPIPKYLDMDCLVTDEGRFVMIMRPTVTGGVSLVTPMDTAAYRDRVSKIRKAISAMEQDIGAPHMALLINAIYRDEDKDDAFQRLHYLQLWQSLVEAGPRWLNYQGKDIRHDNVVVAGKKTLQQLTEYRDDIAHWWTDTIDGNFLADLQRTINELILRKYF